MSGKSSDPALCSSSTWRRPDTHFPSPRYHNLDYTFDFVLSALRARRIFQRNRWKPLRLQLPDIRSVKI